MMGFLDYIEKLSSQTTLGGAADVWADPMREMGFEHYMIGFFDHEQGADAPGPVTLTNYDQDWLDLYGEKYVSVDPVLRRALKTAVPFSWSLVKPETNEQHEFFEESAFRVGRFGVSSKLPGPPSRSGAISVCGFNDMNSDKVLERVFAFSAAAHMQMVAIQQANALEYVRLTQRQMECLQWLATDLSRKEIAKEMGIGVETVIQHVKDIYDEMGVSKRISAVTLGISWGLISLRDGSNPTYLP